MRCGALVLLAGALACRPESSSATPETKPTTVATDPSAPLRFAWPAGSSAVVTERILKDGKHAVTRYRIVTEVDGDALLVWYRDFAFVELQGVDLRDPEAAAKVHEVERQLAGAIPPYRVARDGTWLGASDLDGLAEHFAKLLSPRQVETLRALLANPKLRAVIDAKLREVWQAWAEGWVGLELAPGERYAGNVAMDVAGTRIEVPFVVERFATTDDDGIRLRATQTLEGEQAIQAVGGMIEEFVEAMPTKPAKPMSLEGLAVRRVHLREATLDPTTLLPRRAYTRVTIAVTREGKTTEKIEEHEWTFAWDPAAARP